MRYNPEPIIVLMIGDEDNTLLMSAITKIAHLGILNHNITRISDRDQAQRLLAMFAHMPAKVLIIFHKQRPTEEVDTLLHFLLGQPRGGWYGDQPIIIYSPDTSWVNMSSRIEREKQGRYFLVPKSSPDILHNCLQRALQLLVEEPSFDERPQSGPPYQDNSFEEAEEVLDASVRDKPQKRW